MCFQPTIYNFPPSKLGCVWYARDICGRFGEVLETLLLIAFTQSRTLREQLIFMLCLRFVRHVWDMFGKFGDVLGRSWGGLGEVSGEVFWTCLEYLGDSLGMFLDSC